MRAFQETKKTEHEASSDHHHTNNIDLHGTDESPSDILQLFAQANHAEHEEVEEAEDDEIVEDILAYTEHQ